MIRIPIAPSKIMVFSLAFSSNVFGIAFSFEFEFTISALSDGFDHGASKIHGQNAILYA